MQKCPCHSNQSYALCCRPFLQNEATPDTAEQLMRSRYTAYTLGEADYLEKTHHPQTLEAFDKVGTQKMSSKVAWLTLEVIDTTQGTLKDTEGHVEFKATYKVDGVRYTLHENSRFVKEAQGWLYVDGVTPSASNKTHPKVARNALCPCHSGKKYKKCCGV